MEKQVISARQFTIITLLCSIGSTILIIPSSIAQVTKQDAWIVAIISVALSFLLVKLYISVGNSTPDLSLVEANEKILGKFIGKAVSIAFTLFTFLSSGELLYYIGNFMQTEVMPETPTVAFVLLFMLIIMFATYLGLEVFARSAEILFSIFLFFFIIFVIFISPDIKIQNIQPLFEATTGSFIYGILLFVSTSAFPLVVLLMIFPSAVNVKKAAQKGFYIGTLVGGLILIILIALSILVLGATNTTLRTFPSYTLAQSISIGNFLQRIEIIMASMWIITIYIRAFIYFYASVKGLGQVLNIKDHRPLILPLGMIAVALSQIVHPNIVHSEIFIKEIWIPYSSIFAVFLPLLLLIVAKIRKIPGKESTIKTSNSDNDKTEQSLTIKESQTE
ncbi:endospore germination permease [Lysinibacillus sp. NPDC096418]|uniref:GerAB/ArcD/ProY family transporter n=1 Tax=Lysinibacillus sp. NPDC096418 TaxID=3364138 RepID=UPI00380F9215